MSSSYDENGAHYRQRDKWSHLGACEDAILEKPIGSHTRARSRRTLNDCCLAFGPERHNQKGIHSSDSGDPVSVANSHLQVISSL